MPRSASTSGLRPRTIATLSAIVVLAAGLTACTSLDPDQTPDTGSASASAPPEPSATTTQEPSAATSEPLGEAVATLPDGRGTVDVAVRSLVRDDNGTTMTLRVDFTPHLSAPGTAKTLSGINADWFIFPELLDRENLKRYSVITGEGPRDWLTNGDAESDDGEVLASWFVHSAPEDAVETFTLTMDGWAVEIPAVEVTA